MIIQKTISIILKIEHHEMTGLMADIYLRKANEKIVGHCFAGAYITEIIKLEHSDLEMKLKYGIVNIMIECNAIVYQENDILTGAIVTYRSKTGHTICEDKNGMYIATVSDAHDFHSLHIDQMVLLRVLECSYPILKNKMSITVSINVIDYDLMARRQFEIGLPKKVSEMPEFNDLIERIKSELEKIKKFSPQQKKIYNKFEDILYPYKKKPKYNSKQIKNITTFKEGLILKWDALPKNNLDVLQVDRKVIHPKDKNNSGEILGDDIHKGNIEAIKIILIDKLLYCILLRELSDLYDDKQLKLHENIWIYYTKRLKK